MSKKTNVIEELKKLNVVFDYNASEKVLSKLLKDTLKANKNPETSIVGKTKIKAKKVLVWLKTRAYVSDTERVNAGVYLLDKVPARLSKLPENDCEVLDTEVNSRKIAQIARWAGINPDGLDDEEILSKVLSPEFKPFS